MDKQTNAYVLKQLTGQFGESIHEVTEPYGLLTFHTMPDTIQPVLQFVKEQLQFTYLTDITAVHYPTQAKAFAVVYHVHNLVENLRIRIKVFLENEDLRIPSATVLWAGANWMERETYDFFGIQFEGHPDLRRILNMDELDVFPMRREYPLEDPNRVDKRDFYFGR